MTNPEKDMPQAIISCAVGIIGVMAFLWIYSWGILGKGFVPEWVDFAVAVFGIGAILVFILLFVVGFISYIIVTAAEVSSHENIN